MQQTEHAKRRQQQRCLSPFIVEMLMAFGTAKPAPGGAEHIAFDHKAWKRFERYAGTDAQRNIRLRNAYLIVHGSQIITNGWRH